MSFQQHHKRQENKRFCYQFCALRISSLSSQYVFPNKSERIEETSRNEECIHVFGIFNPKFGLDWLELVVYKVTDITPSSPKTIRLD